MKERADTIFFRPIIPLLLAMMAGIITGSRIPGNAKWVYGICAICAARIIVSIRKNTSTFSTPLILFASLGYLLLQPWVSPSFPPHHIIHFLDKQAWEITGTIKSPPFRDAKRTRFILEAERLEWKQRSYPSIGPTTGRIQVAVYGKCPELRMGGKIRFVSKIRSFRNFGNPGAFNYRQYMTFKRVWGAAYTSGKRLLVLEKSPQSGIKWRISQARKRISQFIDTAVGQGDENAVLKALVIGDRSSISKALNETFQRTGVGHLLAISGLHIGMIATISFFLFRTILSYIEPILRHAWTRRGAAVLSIFPVCIYGLLAGMSPSTQRAVIMVGVFLMTFLLQREQDPVNTLSVAALIILMVNPPSLFSISFQLSFIAVFSIMYGFLWLDGKKHPHTSTSQTDKLRNTLRTYIFASTFAIFGTLPFIMRYFNQVSLVSLVGNLLAVPLIGIGVVPLGLFSVFLYPISTPAAAIFLHAAEAVLVFTLNLLKFLSKIPYAAIKTITPSMVEMVCFYFLGWALLNIINQTNGNRKFAARVAVLVSIIFFIDGG